ncbi:plasmid replication/partition related protein [Comamonas terrigena]|uniref:plasmid replication/partition related protein n=1 Tax=Comamonas terrigena TaxID=32013 RepID=UPI00244BAA34|nr:plasmid replication/partition related protein [Comamonas terrigena]MDH0048490.1 plasmid replication/partition related protein [Comamonas terrigena]MDH0510898.1 plasmid replication/partition related protein [Comamonas terrigena]MDH1090195.1 plasmid replication/partition related protein [Comamonas terrigena]MDH1499650.1 plasmid replication/partition related protein [Comamonas terrigena]
MNPEEIQVLPELKAYIDPLTPDEHESLERSILDEGCRDALVLWGNILVDGHNRFGICQKHGLPFKTIQNERFQNMEDIHLWMIDQHLGRRSVSDFQRGVLALRKREIIAERRAAAAAAVNAAKAQAGEAATDAPWEGDTDPVVAQALATMPKVPDQALDTREALARAARLSAGQVKMIETIQEKAAPEVVAAVRAGELTLNAAAVVATLPMEEQQAVAAEGADGLKQAAKRLRDAKKKPKAEKLEAEEGAEAAPQASAEELQVRVAELEAENERLKLQVKTLQELLAEQV